MTHVLVEAGLLEILKSRRNQLGLSQGTLAKRMGLSTMGLSYLEKGSRQLKLEILELWAQELGLDIEIKIKESP